MTFRADCDMVRVVAKVNDKLLWHPCLESDLGFGKVAATKGDSLALANCLQLAHTTSACDSDDPSFLLESFRTMPSRCLACLTDSPDDEMHDLRYEGRDSLSSTSRSN